MNSRELQEKLLKLSKQAHWEPEDLLDFVCDFVEDYGYAEELVEALEDELDELDDMAEDGLDKEE